MYVYVRVYQIYSMKYDSTTLLKVENDTQHNSGSDLEDNLVIRDHYPGYGFGGGSRCHEIDHPPMPDHPPLMHSLTAQSSASDRAKK